MALEVHRQRLVGAVELEVEVLRELAEDLGAEGDLDVMRLADANVPLSGLKLNLGPKGVCDGSSW
jgi:hypothetical protein